MKLTHLRSANALRITPCPAASLPVASTSIDLRAIIDVSTGGRLIGIELRLPEPGIQFEQAMRHWVTHALTLPPSSADDRATAYIELSAPDDGAVRSADVVVTAGLAQDAIVSITIPRRGHGYEISYPSGNR